MLDSPVDVLVCWRLDRLGSNLKHLITLLDELPALGTAFVSLAEGIDATTPAGKLQGGTVDSRGDHRIAMLAAVAGLVSREGVRIEGAESAAISFPGFFDLLDSVVQR